MNIKVKKLTDADLLRKANSFTTGKDSKMGLPTAYKTGHSPTRTQQFWVEMTEIPLFVASQLVRSHVGVQCFQRSKRTDRGAADFREVCNDLSTRIANLSHVGSEVAEAVIEGLASEVRKLAEEYDRYAPTDLAFIINAEAIINMSSKRLCSKASKETREIWRQTLDLLEEIDPDLVQMCKRPCVWYGFCREQKSCGYMASDAYKAERKAFKELFKPKA